ncbi:MAG: GGDEF domain-containing protein [Pseudomonadales bacterium]|nr:GGDEF domain-containing protein [Gammaproteobacteria bacterium]NNL56501.1 GGDEF domain-containing protein [Pseudomonadales bacterium]
MTLDFPENKVTASRYVREAIPKMVQNDIAPNPFNFALWYSYVSNRDFELNLELDNTLAEQGTCPADVSRDLFKKYVIKDEFDLQLNLQASLANLIQEMAGDVQATRAGATEYRQSLKSSLATLQGGEQSAEQINDVVQTLIQSTNHTSKFVDSFEAQLQTAEQEIAALKLQLEEKEKDAYVDALTLMGNRRAFDQRLYHICEAGDTTATLVLVDIDHFKQINDNFGHLLGDKVLQGVGQILQKLCPEGGLAARYGGEEFAFLIDAPASAGLQLAEEARVMLQRLSLRQKSADKVIDSVSASFGVAEKLPNEHAEQLIQRADKALYRAKQSGRNRVEAAA